MTRAPQSARTAQGAAAVNPPEAATAASHDIDRVIHEPARLHLVALLSAVEESDFVSLQRQTGLTGGNLSTHVSRLERAGYVLVEKGFADKRPRTTLSLTPAGQDAFAHYRRTLESMLGGLRDEPAPDTPS